MTQADMILDTLKKVSDRVGDPKDRIYARLFAEHPEYEDLFVMDGDGGVRGSMLATCFECIIGVAEGNDLPRFELQAARMSHEGYGVSESELDAVFIAIRDVCRDVLAGEWTPAMEAGWADLLDRISEIGLQQA